MYKFLVSIVALAISTTALASDVPEYMRGGKIVVTLKDGKSYEFSTDEYMVVRRHATAPPTTEAPVQVVERSSRSEETRNVITAFIGSGAGGLQTQHNPSSVTINSRQVGVFGFGFSRRISELFSVQAVGLSNRTGVLGLGVNF